MYNLKAAAFAADSSNMEIYRFILISVDLYRFCVDLHGFTCILHGFKLIYMFLYGSMLIYMRFNVSIYFSDVFISLVWPSSVPQALFFPEKMAFLDF